jgi:RNA polymerase sigma-70 factor (ECF subfamily)
MMSKYRRFVARALRRAGAPRSDLDDAIQRTFIVLSRRLDGTPVKTERQFLRGVAQNVAFNLRRTQARRREVPGDPPEGVEALGTPEHLVDRKRMRELVDRVLDDMDPPLRAVLTLHVLNEMNLTEISALLAIPRGTAASRLRRARLQFRDHVEESELAWAMGTPRAKQGAEPARLLEKPRDALERALLEIGGAPLGLLGLRGRTLAALGLRAARP